jgi:regulator of sigma E protease
MDFIFDGTHYVISFLVVLTVLVFIHELGHFWVARRNGVRVETFSIGFGPELFGWNDRRGTRWKISVLPLGGYVKMFGEGETVLDAEGKERPLSPAEKAVSFAHKSLGQRAAIVFAGPAANFLLAIVIMAALYATYGKPYQSNEVGGVRPESAAAAAGIQPGDRVVAINGQATERFDQIADIVKLGLDEPLEVAVLRGEERLVLNVSPRIVDETDIFGNKQRVGQLGIESAGEGGVVEYDPFTAVWVAVQETYRLVQVTFTAVGQMIAGSRPADELRGVLSIGKMAGDVASIGIVSLIGFAALLSVNLGLINLFPIPMLDGGHLAFYAVEAVRGRPLGARAQEWGFRIGLALVLCLMVFATWNDLVSLKVVDYLKNLVT